MRTRIQDQTCLQQRQVFVPASEMSDWQHCTEHVGSQEWQVYFTRRQHATWATMALLYCKRVQLQPQQVTVLHKCLRTFTRMLIIQATLHVDVAYSGCRQILVSVAELQQYHCLCLRLPHGKDGMILNMTQPIGSQSTTYRACAAQCTMSCFTAVRASCSVQFAAYNLQL